MKLSNLEFFKPRMTLIGFILAGALLLFMITRCVPENRAEEHMKQLQVWKYQAAAAIARADSLKLEVVKTNQLADSMTRRDSVRVAEIGRLNGVVKRERIRLDSIRHSLGQTLPDTCKPALELADRYRRNADSLQKGLDSASTTIQSQTIQLKDIRLLNTALVMSNDSLKKVVISVPLPKKERFLGFLPMPSRTTTFIVGTVIGAVAVGSAVR